jgi:hypothetical protein
MRGREAKSMVTRREKNNRVNLGKGKGTFRLGGMRKSTWSGSEVTGNNLRLESYPTHDKRNYWETGIVFVQGSV